jgi:hypothetical protein
VKQLLGLTTWCLTFVSMNLALTVNAAEPVVKLTKQDHTVAVTIDGQDFTTFHTDPKWKKPYFSPVKTSAGSIITRPIEATQKEHPHHKGIWVAIDEVNGNKFWREEDTIQNTQVELVKAEGNPAELRVTNLWQGKDGQPVVTETTDIRIYGNRLLTYDIRFAAGKKPVTWADTKEGLFGIRLADSVREKQADKAAPGGQVTNAEGLKTTAECWGKESAWVDYTGLVEGKTHGAAIFDHPKNFRRSRYHVRDYGLFTISPFGQHSYTNGKLPADELVQPADTTIRLRYAIYIHDGDAEQGHVKETYASYVKHAGE